MKKDQMRHLMKLFLLTVALTGSTGAFALAGSYDLKGLIPAGNKAYPFGILRLNMAHRPSQNLLLIGAFDTEALFTRVMANAGHWSYGVDLGGHMVDWQNLEFLVDSDGTLRKDISLRATQARGEVFLSRKGMLSGKHPGRFMKVSLGYEYARLQPREKKISGSTVGAWAIATAKMGSMRDTWFIPGFVREHHFLIAFESRYRAQEYKLDWQQVPVSVASDNDVSLQINWGHHWESQTSLLNLSMKAGFQNLAAPNEARDLTFYFSQGGPEKAYRRLAGFAYSEFRTPIYGLINLDYYAAFASEWKFWAVLDFLVMDAHATGQTSFDRNAHAGSGVGIIYKPIALPLSFYARTDFALTARREPKERVQFFMGASGIF